ncbi:hypothetical protein KP78_06390 [Jeotgalibacillus soli]|uniref:Uncharacterized protein n=1 Tax=Jeotgalibacillus soli TaxID=889306 RepID=A0A0C2W3K1_9BACL|nr:hypothetical protein KP78_06390 [Jeotgalibacillus soli]
MNHSNTHYTLMGHLGRIKINFQVEEDVMENDPVNEKSYFSINLN